MRRASYKPGSIDNGRSWGKLGGASGPRSGTPSIAHRRGACQVCFPIALIPASSFPTSSTHNAQPPRLLSTPRCMNTASKMSVTIDHEGFPHIIKLILSYATLGTRAAFSATCKQYREDIGDTLRHVRLRYDGTAALPGFADSSNSPVPCIPSLVSVIDLYGYFWNYAERKRIRRAFKSQFTNLQAIRRFPTSEEPSSSLGTRTLARLGNVPTIVDYLDVDILPKWWRKKSQLDLNACLTRHILHLRWCNDDEPRFPSIRFLVGSRNLERVMVLWPHAEKRSKAARSRLTCETFLYNAALLNGPKRLTIVGPESLRSSAAHHGRYLSYETWWEELGDQKSVVGKWVEVQKASHW